VFFHGEVLFAVYGKEDIVFDLSLHFGLEFVPDIGVGSWTEIRETESELRGGEVPALEGSLA
jgi:hypothetical protein